jgi:ATP-dependent RNA helicase DeaD
MTERNINDEGKMTETDITTFAALGIEKRIRKAIGEMGFTAPMPIQQQVIPFLLHETRDLVALAHTGTGKTAAFGIPIIQGVDPSSSATQALILAPTRELCLQITDDLNHFAKHIHGLNIVPIYGGASIMTQIRQVASGAQIVVATPGRMLDMLNRKKVNVSEIRWLILDEADEMLNMGFKEDLNAILAGTPADKRVLLFSATMPGEIEAIAKGTMHNPESITVGSKNAGVATVHHQYYIVHAKDRYLALKRIADFYPDIYAIVFCRTKIETQEVADGLIRDGYNADALHGDLSQPQRDSVMNRFRGRNLQMLVATDVAARGIDVSDLTHIINYNLPDDNEHYTHRSGRTGRAGKAGISIAIVNLKETYRIRLIEKQLGRKFEAMKIPSGKDVCEKQLFHLIEKLKGAEVRHSDIDAFLPSLYGKLKDLSKEEVIQRFVSIEFNRFLNDYRNAPDLNVDLKKRDDGSGSVRMFVNVGEMEKFNAKTLKGYLLKTADAGDIPISRIDVMRCCSFFETGAQHVDALIAAFKREKFKKRRVMLERADRRTSQDRGSNGHAKARSAPAPFKKKRRY